MAIEQFEANYKWLSSSFVLPAPVHIRALDGRLYELPTVEHGYQMLKASTFDAQKRFLPHHYNNALWSHAGYWISPNDAKKLGAQLLNEGLVRPDWWDVRVNMRYKLTRQKFRIISLGRLLVETGDEQLIDGNKVHDTFWGVCTRWAGCKCGRSVLVADETHTSGGLRAVESNQHGVGENHQGQLLMQVRRELVEGRLKPRL